jgi:NADH-quinone oxidoreductase subunit J
MNAFPAGGLVVKAVFLLSLVTMGFGALVAVLSRRLIRSVCGLAICCVGLAGLYYFLHSPFLALMEILIYVGAVCVTIVFAVMLAEPDEPADEESPGAALAWGAVAVVVAGAIFWGVCRLNTGGSWPAGAPAEKAAVQNAVKDIGYSLLTTYSLAFELISLALLVAILGALVIARTGRKGQ